MEMTKKIIMASAVVATALASLIVAKTVRNRSLAGMGEKVGKSIDETLKESKIAVKKAAKLGKKSVGNEEQINSQA